MTEAEGVRLRKRIENIGVSQAVLAAVAGVFDCDVSRALRGLHVPTHRLAAITSTITTIEDLRQTPNSLVPNFKSAESIAKAIEHLKKMREQEAEAAKKPIVFATSRPIRTKAPADAVPTNLAEIARVMGSNSESGGDSLTN